MEPNVDMDCRKDRKKDCFCSWLIVSVIVVVLAFFVGVLVAELTAILSILTVGSIIALIITLGVLLVISVINVICCKKDNKRKYC